MLRPICAIRPRVSRVAPTRTTYLARSIFRNGHTALDVGCGPGTDLLALAASVGPEGSVIGIDADPVMVAHAQASAGDSRVEVRLGDAHALPVADRSADRNSGRSHDAACA